MKPHDYVCIILSEVSHLKIKTLWIIKNLLVLNFVTTLTWFNIGSKNVFIKIPTKQFLKGLIVKFTFNKSFSAWMFLYIYIIKIKI